MGGRITWQGHLEHIYREREVWREYAPPGTIKKIRHQTLAACPKTTSDSNTLKTCWVAGGRIEFGVERVHMLRLCTGEEIWKAEHTHHFSQESSIARCRRRLMSAPSRRRHHLQTGSKDQPRVRFHRVDVIRYLTVVSFSSQVFVVNLSVR